MIHRIVFGAIAGLALFAAPPDARAALMLSLSAGATDLSQIHVGDTVSFEVDLSGLGAGDLLDYVAGTVDFDATLLGSGTNVQAGAIVPDLSGFAGTGLSGEADALYDAVFLALSNTPISSNGAFYTFDVTAEAPGSGVLSFDVSSLAAADGSNSPILLFAGPDLNFDVLPSTKVVPEPGSFGLFFTGVVGGALVARFRKTRSRRRAACDPRKAAGFDPASSTA